MIVEMVGIPGAGKSTIAQILSQDEEFENICLKRRTGKRYLLRFVVQHPVLSISLLLQVLAHNISSLMLLKRKFLLLSYALARTQMAFDVATSRVRILDEGIAHYFLSLHEKPITKEQAKRFIKRYILSDIIIFVQTSQESADQRMRSRKRGVPRRHLSIDHKKWMDTFVENAQMYRKAIEEMFPAKIIVVNTNILSPEQATQEVKRQLSLMV